MTHELLAAPLDELLARARGVRDTAHGTRITYSPKVFIPLTMLCRDKCGYCTFAQPPARLQSPYLSPADVLRIAQDGARMGCHEALFTLGEAPEERRIETVAPTGWPKLFSPPSGLTGRSPFRS